MLQLFNSLTRQKETFKPIEGKKVGLYTCGPTVYNYAHIGNLRAYVFSDILKRTLAFKGYEVHHVMNITDVGHLINDGAGEDKLEEGARRERKTPEEIARFYEDAFKNDLARLNIIPADVYPRAAEHVKEQIAMIKKLEKNGYIYETDTAVYYDVRKLKDYTKLSGQKLSEKKTGARKEVEVDTDKKHPADFALWFKLVGKHKDHTMRWSSPWGEGFPGWHIECSAMSTKYLGEEFDIHTGGVDHIAVHHTNERAQNIGAFGHPTVRFWMHNEFVVLGGSSASSPQATKMAKSDDNFITLQDVIDKGFDPMAYRYFLLGTHYRQKVNFSWEALEGAQHAYKKLVMAVREVEDGAYAGSCGGCSKYEPMFEEPLDDDLNTPQALAVLWQLVQSTCPSVPRAQLVEKFDEVLGLGLAQYVGKKEKIPDEVVILAAERQKARDKKDWTQADKIRDKMEATGYIVEDTEKGYIITKF